MRLNSGHDVCEVLDSSLNASFFLVKFAQEAVFKLNHEVGKAKEKIGLDIFLRDNEVMFGVMF